MQRFDELDGQFYVGQVRVHLLDVKYRIRQAVAVLVVVLQPTADQSHEAPGVIGQPFQDDDGAIAHRAQAQAFAFRLPDKGQAHLFGEAVQLLGGHQLAVDQVGGQARSLSITEAPL